jgi:4-hydroxy-tetrahydrodipicolinate reductase
MAEAVRIAVLGAAGKMGGAIVRAMAETPTAAFVVAVERPDFPAMGADASRLAGLPESGVRVQADRPGRGAADVWIDFSSPGVAVANANVAAQAGAAIVIGTTGLSAQDKDAIALAAKKVPIVLAPNMSVGVNVMLRLVADAARALGAGYDVEIVETHHRAKRDAPSGTALRLAEAVAEATGRDLGKSARYERHGDIGPRTADEIGIQTLRGGDVVGDHTVFFLGQGERIEITHRASSREVLARGAVRAALWLHGRASGLYDMRDVLGLK